VFLHCKRQCFSTERTEDATYSETKRIGFTSLNIKNNNENKREGVRQANSSQDSSEFML
jgi:hypothetical protein